MRQATLYTLQSQRIICGDYVEITKSQRHKNIFPLRNGNDRAFFADKTVAIDRLPVHRISKIEHGQRKDHYIALSRELQEIIEAPFAAEMEKAAQREKRAYSILISYEGRLEKFNTMTWWQRVWHCICGRPV